MKKTLQKFVFAGVCSVVSLTSPASLANSQDSHSSSTMMEKADEFATYLEGVKKQALQGDRGAIRKLVIHYEVAGNAEQGAYWIEKYMAQAEKDALAGDIEASLDLGKHFLVGSRLYPKNLEKAREWFQKAADSGNADAMYQIGLMLMRGEGGAPDAIGAKKYFDQAQLRYQNKAIAGDANAAYWVAILNEKKLVSEASPEKSIPWLIQAAESGNVSAQCLLALKYRDGAGCAVDTNKFIYWSERAAEANDLGAIMELGITYRDGKGVPKNTEKAEQWFKKGCELDDPYSMFALAQMWMQAEAPTELHRQEALTLYQKAAKIGSRAAALSAASHLIDGTIKHENARVEAFRLLRNLVDTKGDPEAAYMLALLYLEEGERDQGLSLLKSSAESAWVPALKMLGSKHLNPMSEANWNPVLSYYYWTEAEKLGDESAGTDAAMLLYGGGGAVILLMAFFVWKFHCFARTRQAALDDEENAGKK